MDTRHDVPEGSRQVAGALELTLADRAPSGWRARRRQVVALLSAVVLEQSPAGLPQVIEVRSRDGALLGEIDAGEDPELAERTLELFRQRAQELSAADFLARYQLGGEA